MRDPHGAAHRIARSPKVPVGRNMNGIQENQQAPSGATHEAPARIWLTPDSESSVRKLERKLVAIAQKSRCLGVTERLSARPASLPHPAWLIAPLFWRSFWQVAPAASRSPTAPPPPPPATGIRSRTRRRPGRLPRRAPRSPRLALRRSSPAYTSRRALHRGTESHFTDAARQMAKSLT